jgi:hypothetical protein
MRVTALPCADAPFFRYFFGKSRLRAAMHTAPAHKTVLNLTCAIEKEYFGDQREV